MRPTQNEARKGKRPCPASSRKLSPNSAGLQLWASAVFLRIPLSFTTKFPVEPDGLHCIDPTSIYSTGPSGPGFPVNDFMDHPCVASKDYFNLL